MRVLDLFSGIGGFSLGLERAGMETVAFCEIEPFCRKVLRKHWPDVPIYEDVRTLDYDGTVDLICGGYPCQPFSVAGKRKGATDDRHLWPAMFSLIQKYRPRWVIGENVAGHVNMGLDEVLSDLEGEDYTCRTFIIPACAVDAQHRRDRVWIVANSECKSSKENSNERSKHIRQRHCLWVVDMASGETVADATCRRSGASGEKIDNTWETNRVSGIWEFDGNRNWSTEPAVGRVANGIPRRMDRLRALGNAVVPQIPEIIGKAIMRVDAAL